MAETESKGSGNTGGPDATASNTESGDNNSSSSNKPTPSPQVSAASRRFQQTQAQVDEVVGIMRTNVEKVLERDTKLSELVSRHSVDAVSTLDLPVGF